MSGINVGYKTLILNLSLLFQAPNLSGTNVGDQFETLALNLVLLFQAPSLSGTNVGYQFESLTLNHRIRLHL